MPVRAGPLTMELDGTTLRHVRYGSLEIVESAAGLVRDLAWNTLPGVVVHSEVNSGDGHFRASLESEHRQDDLHLRAWTTISGHPDGNIELAFRWRAESRFRYMRIGISVVHPVGSHRGRRYEARGSQGISRGMLPEDIAPVRTDERSELPLIEAFDRLDLELDGVTASFRFRGEAFEMEDQRNWGDASYKTFGTPLSTPVPLTAEPGQTFEQDVRLDVSVHRPPRRRRPARVELSDVVVGDVPRLGLSLPHGPSGAPPVSLLTGLRPAHLRLDLDVDDTVPSERLADAARVAAASGAALEVAVVSGHGRAAALGIIPELARLGLPDGSRLVVMPDADPDAAGRTIGPDEIGRIRTSLMAAGLALPIIAASPGSFCELNRDPHRSSSADGVAFPFCPTLHAVDDDTFVSSVTTLGRMVAQAVGAAAGRAVHVGPIALAPRHGPFAGGPTGLAGLPPGVDPRQASLVGAAWTAGSLAQLCGRGASSATYFETHGLRGVAMRGGPRMAKGSGRMRPLPLFHVLRDVGLRQGDTVLACAVSDDSRLAVLATRRQGALSVMLVNLQPRSQRLSMVGLPGRTASVRTLWERTLPAATADPAAFARRVDHEPLRLGRLVLALPPYAVTWIETRAPTATEA